MAYTSTPEQSTYKTERYSFVGNQQQFDGASLKNQRTVNMYPELNFVSVTQDKTYFLKKRPGLKIKSQLAAGNGRGIYSWLGKQFVVIGASCYVDDVLLFTLTSDAGQVGFSDYFGQTFGQALIIVDGNDGWVIKSDLTVTLITSPNFPRPHVLDPVFIDEYLILSKAGTQDFYQSALDDPLTWTPGDFNSSEMFPDVTVAITKFKNYLVVGGKYSIEFFYDSGTTSGSSFQRSEAVIQQVGVLNSRTLRTTEDEIVFLGESGQGGKTVWMIEKFKAVDIGTEPIRQAIDAEGVNMPLATAIVVRTCGHQFYILSLTYRTFVYDFDLKIWHEWMFDGGVFEFRFSSYNSSNNPTLLHSHSGIVYELDQFTYQDQPGTPIVCLHQTDDIDFKSYNRKSWNRLVVSGDMNDGPDSFMNVSWSDNNFTTVSSPRQLKLNAVMPAIFKMGMARSRQLKFVFNENRPLRLEYYEIDCNILMH